MKLVKVNQKQIKNYFKKHKFTTYEEISRTFGVSDSLIRKKFGKYIISCLNNNGKLIIYAPHHIFDSNGFKRIKGFLFSKHNNIKSTLLSIIRLNDCISSKKLYALLGFNVRPQVSQLIKERKIFVKKKGIHSIYSINPLQDEIIKEKEFDITSLRKEEDKLLRHLQIIKEAREIKKTQVAKKYNITVDTIRNIEERFNKDGIKGLIHTRKHKAIKISSPKQAAVIAEVVKYPNKSLKEIQESVNEPIGLRKIGEIATEMKDIQAQKKILLELQ